MPFFLNYTHETSHILITTFIIAKNMKCLKVVRLCPCVRFKKKKKKTKKHCDSGPLIKQNRYHMI